MILKEKILKVSEINALARTILEGNFSQVLIAGEISNLTIPSSGHSYFSLKDESAQIRAVMFRYHKTSLKFQPQNGSHVVVTAKVSLYEPRGDYQLIVEWMEPARIGLLYAKFLQLKNKLAAEGLFDEKYKKLLPQLPQSIGVITSPTGAVIHDILSILKRRFPGITVIIYPTLVQGNAAPPQIVTALQTANDRKECEVVILARGGGYLEDLWPFNEEIVARAIFASEIPIVSAIGHESDVTIADFVADIRAPTPSAAAELVVPDVTVSYHALKNLKPRLINLIQNQLQKFNLLLINLQQRLRHPSYHLRQQLQHLDELEHRLQIAIQHQLDNLQQRLVKTGMALNLVSPLATLTRGYAVVSKNNTIIHRASEVAPGDKVQAKLAEGELRCLVQAIVSCQKDPHNN